MPRVRSTEPRPGQANLLDDTVVLSPEQLRAAAQRVVGDIAVGTFRDIRPREPSDAAVENGGRMTAIQVDELLERRAAEQLTERSPTGRARTSGRPTGGRRSVANRLKEGPGTDVGSDFPRDDLTPFVPLTDEEKTAGLQGLDVARNIQDQPPELGTPSPTIPRVVTQSTREAIEFAKAAALTAAANARVTPPLPPLPPINEERARQLYASQIPDIVAIAAGEAKLPMHTPDATDVLPRPEDLYPTSYVSLPRPIPDPRGR